MKRLPNIRALAVRFGSLSQALKDTTVAPLETFLETRRISNLLTKQEIARGAYDQARQAVPFDPDNQTLQMLKQDIATLSDAILSSRRLLRVSPEVSAMSLHRQLIENEKVHEIADIDDLRKNRLGTDKDNKDCQALIVPTKSGIKILSCIFRYHTTVPDHNGMIDVRELPGNVDAIRDSAVRPLNGTENLTGYWTISSMLNGSGPILVSDLAKVTPRGRVETTISPVRGFTGTHDRDHTMHASDEDIRAQVIGYMMGERDSVRNFHMGNGAYLAWIHVNRDAPEKSKDWITVNYYYNRDELAINQNMFKNGLLPVSPALYSVMDHTQVPRAFNVCSQPYISRPSADLS